MANRDQPCGFRPLGEVKRVRPYVAGAACYPGDAVNLQADGKVDPADASEALLGVAMSYASADGQTVLVADDPDQLFVVQADSTHVDAQTDVGKNANIVATAGDTSYKISRHELQSSSLAETTTLPLKLLGIDSRPDNALGEFVDCVVSINNHQLGKQTDTDGE
jgi:hypothetical protein